MSFTKPKTKLGGFLAIAGSLCLLAMQAAQAIEVSESKDVSITVYNQNFGLVRDVREIMFKDGRNNIKFDDVAAGIDPTTVSFISLSAPNSVAVREQNYQFDLMDVTTILKRSVGREVKFRQFLPAGLSCGSRADPVWSP